MTPQAWAKFKRSIGDLRFEHYVSLVLSQRTIKPLSLTRRICRGHSSPLHPGEQKFSDPLSNLASTEKRNPLKLQSLCKACWKDKHKLCSLKTQSNWIAMSFAHVLGEGVCVCVCAYKSSSWCQVSSLFFDTGSLTDPKTHHFGWTGWLMTPHPYPRPVLQKGVTIPSFYMVPLLACPALYPGSNLPRPLIFSFYI